MAFGETETNQFSPMLVHTRKRQPHEDGTDEMFSVCSVQLSRRIRIQHQKNGRRRVPNMFGLVRSATTRPPVPQPTLPAWPKRIKTPW